MNHVGHVVGFEMKLLAAISLLVYHLIYTIRY